MCRNDRWHLTRELAAVPTVRAKVVSSHEDHCTNCGYLLFLDVETALLGQGASPRRK
jgi:hypothetical protein